MKLSSPPPPHTLTEKLRVTLGFGQFVKRNLEVGVVVLSLLFCLTLISRLPLILGEKGFNFHLTTKCFLNLN